MIDDATVRKELEKEDDHVWLSALSIWLRRNLPEFVVDEKGDVAESLPGMVARRLCKLASTRQFYQQRYREFDKLARTLPEPYASQAFAILANGKIAPWNETKEPQP